MSNKYIGKRLKKLVEDMANYEINFYRVANEGELANCIKNKSLMNRVIKDISGPHGDYMSYITLGAKPKTTFEKGRIATFEKIREMVEINDIVSLDEIKFIKKCLASEKDTLRDIRNDFGRYAADTQFDARRNGNMDIYDSYYNTMSKIHCVISSMLIKS